ncbi:uncharacterized protein Tco025E_06203 [Trypanosoma conorhini]|uniref:Uncharacterized protein n=1 Tax=Trypanosoma conorhini TaxID=83891 RepID=A0A3R7NXF4_9TRYP|nr:uncharacterized protein Tco025E_06203 [Trypanosoma conorhini]RNF13405.1 hypothetical protein Tco025E_06203 [Trypanosoma conorhini]
MPLEPAEEPLGRFRVVLSRSCLSDPGAVSSCSGGRSVSGAVPCAAASSAAGAGALSSLASGVTRLDNSSQPRRFGGAIVRVSELQSAGGAASSTAPAGREGSARGRPPAKMLWRAMGLAGIGGDEACPPCGDTAGVGSPAAKGVAGRVGQRRMPSSRGGHTNRSSSSSSKKPVASLRRKTERSRGRGSSLQLQPNGAPYEHRWSTVNGRRQLHYGGHTYKGRAAHQLWGKIKAALPPTGSNSSQVSSRVRSTERQKPNGKKRARTGEILAADAISGVQAATSRVVFQRTRQMCAPAPTCVSTTRTGLLLDDDEEPQPKGDAGADVLLLSGRGDGTVSSSETLTTSSLTSSATDEDSLTSSMSSFSSESSSDTAVGRRHDGIVTMAGVRRQGAGSAKTRKPPVLVEHEGWVYPAELLPVLCGQRCADASLAQQAVENAGTFEADAAGREDPENRAGMAQEGHKAESNPKARGLTVLGWGDVGDASLAVHRHREDATATLNSADSLRYEEMDALDSFLDADAADLFVAGDEIGGVRFAP